MIVARLVARLILPTPAEARHVRFKVTPAPTVTVSEVEVLDFISNGPFDLRLTLPDEVLTSAGPK